MSFLMPQGSLNNNRRLRIVLGAFTLAAIAMGLANPSSAFAQQKRPDTKARIAIPGMVGQKARFQRPCGIAISPVDGRVFISDTDPAGSGNTVVSYPSVSSIGATALPDIVIGKAGAVPKGDSSDVTKDPEALAFDQEGSLYVADTSGHRVMIFHPPFTSGMSASIVLGQDKFSWNSLNANRGGAISPGGMKYPRGLALDSKGNLWVADDNNKRVLRFTKGARGFTTGQSPSLIIGNTTNAGAITAVSYNLGAPKALVVDSADRLYVSDYYNAGIVRFAPPYTQGVPIYNNGGNPIDMAITKYGDLYVTVHNAPGGGGKLMRFKDAGTVPQLVLDATMPSANTQSPALSALGSEPLGIGFDAVNNKLLVADYGQSRILLFARYAYFCAAPNRHFIGDAETLKALQHNLNADGATPALVVDGIMGPLTSAAAVKDLQVRLNAGGALPALKVDGILGTQTKLAAVKELQEKLNRAGATPPLDVDGVFGAATIAAIKQVQKAWGLAEDGIAGPNTWAAL